MLCHFHLFILICFLAGFNLRLLKKRDTYQIFVYNVLNRYQSQWSKVENVETAPSKEVTDASRVPVIPRAENKTGSDSSRLGKFSSEENDFSSNRWKLELDWLTKALEPALQLCRWALPTGMFILCPFFFFCFTFFVHEFSTLISIGMVL